MKKEYIRPYLAVESFQLNAAIAGACAGGIALGHGLDDCNLTDDKGYQNPNEYVFGGACPDFNLSGDGVNADGTCYQTFLGIEQYLTS